MSTLTFTPEDATTLTTMADTYIEVWSDMLAGRNGPAASPTSVLWAIEDAVTVFPGLGLTLEQCDGPCGRAVWGAEPTRRLILCDECTAEAHAAGEGLLERRSRKGGRRAAEMAEQLRDAVLEPTTYTGHGIGHHYREDVAL